MSDQARTRYYWVEPGVEDKSTLKRVRFETSPTADVEVTIPSATGVIATTANIVETFTLLSEGTTTYVGDIGGVQNVNYKLYKNTATTSYIFCWDTMSGLGDGVNIHVVIPTVTPGTTNGPFARRIGLTDNSIEQIGRVSYINLGGTTPAAYFGVGAASSFGASFTIAGAYIIPAGSIFLVTE